MKIILTVLLLLPLLSLHAQTGNQSQSTDKEVFVFKFTPGDDIFYDNIFTNGEELQRLFDLIEQYRTQIESRALTIYVEGYCASGPDNEANRQLAMIRSNRVKSRLIQSKGLVEDYFKTTNRAVAYGNEPDAGVIILHVSGRPAVDQPAVVVRDEPKQQPSAVQEMKPATVQETAQTTQDQQLTGRQTFLFKFTPGDDIFYDTQFTNGEELQRLFNLLDRYRMELSRKELTIRVEGYCASEADRDANRRMAMIRSNRVKSRLIESKGLVEDNFNTVNRAVPYEGETDMNVLILDVPEVVIDIAPVLTTDQPEPVTVKTTDEPVTTDALVIALPRQQEELVVSDPSVVPAQPLDEAPQPETIRPMEDAVQQPSYESQETDTVEREKMIKSYFGTVANGNNKPEGTWSLRANLLYRLANMVNAGVEWKPSGSLGILLNAGWSGTEWSGGDRKLRLWMVSPELRWYLGEDNCWFLGVEAHAGKFNIKLSDTGYQGNFMGGGFTAGYRARLSRYFDMDFSLGLGYIYSAYDEYYRENGESVKINEQRLNKNIFGPTQAGVSLIWKLK